MKTRQNVFPLLINNFLLFLTPNPTGFKTSAIYWLGPALFFLVPSFLAAEEPQQSKTGPRPPLAVIQRDLQKEVLPLSGGAVQKTLTVPGYNWRHGCGPTALGMVVGYYDGLGYDNLIPGSAAAQTAAVNQAIASGGNSSSPYPPGSEQHYEDYARPQDYSPNMIADDYITGGRTPHPDNCLADYMDTSQSTRSNYYGWSWSSDVGLSWIGYVNQQDSHYLPYYQVYYTSGGGLNWSVLVQEIDNNRPMVFLVDTDGNGGTDHFVTVVGYRDTPALQYGCLDTWAGSTIRWENFSPIASGTPWGIWGGWSFGLEKEEYTLWVHSSGLSNADIASSTGHEGTTSYSRTVPYGTSVNLQAPTYVGSCASRMRFYGWTGSVTSSSPSITFVMDSGKTVTANFVSDPETVPVPNVLNLTETEAESALITAGLTKGTVAHAFSDITPAGQVMDQDPNYSVWVPCDSAVDLVISDGPTAVIPDLNFDTHVNYLDYSILASYWMQSDCNSLNAWCEGSDLDQRGRVTLYDLTILAENWLLSTADQEAGLVGYWKLNDQMGLRAFDSSGYANHGVLIADPNWTDGLFDGGLALTEETHAVEISMENMNPAQGTVSIWAYSTEFTDQPQYLFGHTRTTDPWSNQIQLFVDDPNGGLNLGLGDSHFLEIDCCQLPPQQWTHIVLTWQSGSYVVYVNAAPVASGSYTGLSELADFADIGNDGSTLYGNQAWKGILDEVKMYNRCLSDEEGTGLFESGIYHLQTQAVVFARQQIDAAKAAISVTVYPIYTDFYTDWVTTDYTHWASGFFPGSLWNFYEYTGRTEYLAAAQDWTEGLENLAYTYPDQDLGFLIFNTFGKGYQLTGYEPYQQVVFAAADTMTVGRFHPIIGAIVAGWGSFEYSVNIDSMMAVEMLFAVAQQSGDPNYSMMAVSHADRIASDLVRPDGSTWQYADYDPATGLLLGHSRLQGQSVDSTWSRGQAWGIYGFTVAYRETGDPAYLDTACLLADYYVDHLPADSIPYWDFDALDIPDAERDSSAAAITTSALLELSPLTPDPGREQKYYTAALRALLSLCTPPSRGGYLAVDSDGSSLGAGIIMRGCYNHGQVCDECLIWGDYYFIESLFRLENRFNSE